MCRLITNLGLIIAGALFLLSGCNSSPTAPDKSASSQTPSANSTARSSSGNASPNDSTQTAGATCADIIGKMEGDVVGGKGSIPADFPAPPAGSTLCGYEGLAKGVFYLNTTLSDEDIMAYYEKELRARGFDVDPPRSPTGEDRQLSFTRAGVVAGYIATNGERDTMSRRRKDFFSIGYAALK